MTHRNLRLEAHFRGSLQFVHSAGTVQNFNTMVILWSADDSNKQLERVGRS